MADPRGFMTTPRRVAQRRPVHERIHDWKEVYPGTPGRAVLPIISEQAGRCMDCGIPFCHTGCPLGNLIPEWNDLVWRSDWDEALERLHATNNFPEFTGRLCPAPCETACVVGINRDPVTIKNVEVAIIDVAWERQNVKPEAPESLTGKTVAVVGSGPAGLAAAQQLTRAGHTVAVYERDDRIGGLLRYGIPDFKMEKKHLESRLRQMRDEGTRFRAGVEIGKDITWSDLRARYDAVVIATGSTVPRELAIPGRDLAGVHFAMEYLVESNKAIAGDAVPNQITAEGKHVVVIGGGDTGADCIGTAHRQGALSVTSLEILAQPSAERQAHQPWPTYPMTFRVASAHEEGGDRVYAVSTSEIVGDEHGRAQALRLHEVRMGENGFEKVEGSERELPAQLVLLAMGFLGPQQELLEQLGVERDERSNAARDAVFMTNVPGIFVAGDAGRGQSLHGWSIGEGRSAAHEVDAWLMGKPSRLPRPVNPTDRPLLA